MLRSTRGQGGRLAACRSKARARVSVRFTAACVGATRGAFVARAGAHREPAGGRRGGRHSFDESPARRSCSGNGRRGAGNSRHRGIAASRRRRSRESGGSRGRRAHRQRMPIVPRAYVTPVPDGMSMPKVARSRTRVVRGAGSMFEPRRCARHSFRYALAPGCRLHRRSRVQAVRQRDDLTDTDIERSGKARRRMNRARDSPARRERRIFHARAKMSARLDHSGERRQSRQARGAPSGSIGERRRPDIVDESLRADRGGPRRPVRDAPAGEERSMRSVTILSCRTAADSCCAAAYCRWADGQMGGWRGRRGRRGRRNTTSRNNFLLKLKKPAKPALQGSAKRFDAL